jgi:release factor glutamine methyltransferase
MNLKIYEPKEDSFLLRDQVLKYAEGKVLDMGTGSGIQAIAASKKADEVLAVDIDSYALEFAESQAKGSDITNIKFKKSDLFSNVKGKFNLIIFNPPYLPGQKGEPEVIAKQISGGKKGYEIIKRFFSQANNYLEKNGAILIVFSSLTNKDKVDGIIQDYCFNFRILSKQNISFETLYVYAVERSWLLEEFMQKGFSDIKKLAKGHRGIIWKAKLKNKNMAIKTKLPSSAAVGNIERESEWLRLLNQKGIGPKLLFAEKDYFAYEFVEGVFIRDFIIKADKKAVKKVLKDVFSQCFILDQLRINKEEMHHPLKHVLIGKKVVLLDFERANKTINPHNVNQFCQYIMNQKDILNKKGFRIDKEKLIKLAKSYKENPVKERLYNIINALN